jgi:hypothetical protein
MPPRLLAALAFAAAGGATLILAVPAQHRARPGANPC